MRIKIYCVSDLGIFGNYWSASFAAQRTAHCAFASLFATTDAPPSRVRGLETSLGESRGQPRISKCGSVEGESMMWHTSSYLAGVHLCRLSQRRASDVLRNEVVAKGAWLIRGAQSVGCNSDAIHLSPSVVTDSSIWFCIGDVRP